jgi:hypothetical protein
MNETNDESPMCALPRNKTLNFYMRKWYFGVLYWIYLYIWCRYCYRHIMRLMHKFNLHYTKVVMPYEKEDFSVTVIGVDIKGKKQQLWCQWCGLRGDVIKYDLKNED